MPDSHYSFRQLRFLTRTLIVGVLTAALGIGCWTPAHAGQHKALLSKDLEARLDAGSAESLTVIIQDSSVDTIAATYGATIKKRLRTGAVLQVTPEQLAAMSSDPEVSHISGDARVRRMMAVTTRAIGADQVWQGIAGLPAYTGAGIGVAIIDSGVENHRALKNRVVASFNFVGGKGRDEYGHGTH